LSLVAVAVVLNVQVAAVVPEDLEKEKTLLKIHILLHH
jgi:hypothetical protein